MPCSVESHWMSLVAPLTVLSALVVPPVVVPAVDELELDVPLVEVPAVPEVLVLDVPAVPP